MNREQIADAVGRVLAGLAPATCACGRELSVARVAPSSGAWLVACRPCGARGVHLESPSASCRPPMPSAPPRGM